jgi:hypothetical protein
MSDTIANGDWGTTFETAVCELTNAEDVSNDGGEYRHVDAIGPEGGRLAIKVARYRIADDHRRGRYWIPKAEIAACDRFAMGVYREGGDVEDICRFYATDIVERRCPTFVDSPREAIEAVSRPPWSRFISPGLLADTTRVGGGSA